MSSPAGVTAGRSKNFDHVGEAEIYSIRRGAEGVRRMTSSLRPLTA